MVWTQDLRHETFRIESTIRDRTLTVCFTGDLEVEEPERLIEYLDEIHAAATNEGVIRASWEFGHVKHVNSGALRALIRWILAIRNENADRQYRVSISGAPQGGPQRASFLVLRSLSSPELVTILPN